MKMPSESTKYPMPPYVPYKTFSSFISKLSENEMMPSHVDKSLMTKMSGSGQSAMISALKSMELVNTNSEPQQRLKKLVHPESPEEYKITLTDIIKNTYPFLFESGFNLQNTTSKQVENKFKDAVGASGSTLTKCISFFLSACKTAQIPVSPHVKAPQPPKTNGNKRKKFQNTQQDNTKPADELGNMNGTTGFPPPLPPEGSMTKFTIPLKDSEDGVVYLPSNLTEQQAKKAVKMAVFILSNYYEIEDN